MVYQTLQLKTENMRVGLILRIFGETWGNIWTWKRTMKAAAKDIEGANEP